MKKIELLDQICKQEYYGLCCGTSEEERSLLEILENSGDILKESGCYKISFKGKLKIFYEFLLKKYTEIGGISGGFTDDYYFDDNKEWFTDHHLNEDNYNYYKEKLLNYHLIEMGSGVDFRVLQMNFDELYFNDYNHISYNITNNGNLIVGDKNKINDEKQTPWYHIGGILYYWGSIIGWIKSLLI